MIRERWYIIGILCIWISYQGLSQCSSPIFFFASAKTDKSITVLWNFGLNLAEGAEISWSLSENPNNPLGTSFLPFTTLQYQVEGLRANTSYIVSIRSICEEDSSEWVHIKVRTSLQHGGSNCQLDIPIQDNTCAAQPQQINYHVHSYDSLDQLGVDYILESVTIIIAHPYPADLSLALQSPSGQRLFLTQFEGTINDHFGDPADSTCTRVTTFSDEACQTLSSDQPPYLGMFIPQESFRQLYHTPTSVNGKWSLEICDRAPDDIGTLIHFSLEFKEQSCPLIPSTQSTPLGPDSVRFYVDNLFAWDSVIILYSEQQKIPENVTDTAFEQFLISQDSNPFILSELSPSRTYYHWVFAFCDGVWQRSSCIDSFQTSCGSISHYFTWDELQECNLCSGCISENPFWQTDNTEGWQVGSGSTSTLLTGPDNDHNGNGAYLYKESSASGCKDRPSILESICLQSTVDSGCLAFFYYHMYGAGIGRLLVLLSEDEFETADTLWQAIGSQGDQWKWQRLYLPAKYSNRIFKIRFQADQTLSSLGDIALGDVLFQGVQAVPIEEYVSYADKDRDSFGTIEYAYLYCGQILPDSLSSNSLDCNDLNASIRPDAPEIPCNQIDENCDGIDDILLAERLHITESVITKPRCNGIADGSIALTISGGVPPYEIQWQNGDTGLMISHLASGAYSVTIADSDSCQIVTRKFVLAPQAPIQSEIFVEMQPSCNSLFSGAVSLLLEGGTAPFDVQWTSGDTGLILDSLPEGRYRAMIQDANGCLHTTAWVNLRNTPSFSSQITILQQPSCSQNANGRLFANTVGGVPPFRYQWNTGDSSEFLIRLPADTYQVSITDATGCESVSSKAILTEPSPIQLTSILVDDVRCYGGSNGHISAIIEGGSPPYNYRWIRPDQVTISQPVLRETIAGYHSLRINDQNGCMVVFDSILVHEPPPIELENVQIDSTSCPLSADGEISFAVTGGSPPYTLSWSDGISQIQHRRMLPSGPYALTLTDAANCKSSFAPFVVPSGTDSLSVYTIVDDPLFCSSPDSAIITTHISGGVAPFQFNWNVGIDGVSLDSVITNTIRQEGSYMVTITDQIGCVGSSQKLEIVALAPIIIDTIDLIRPCPNMSNGQIRIDSKSPFPPQSIIWDSGDTSFIRGQLTEGMYRYTISDQSNCKPLSDSLFLFIPPAPRIRFDTIQSQDSICFIRKDTSRSLFWLLDGDTVSMENSICVSTYDVNKLRLIVPYGEQCDTLLIFDNLSSSIPQLDNDIKIYPNPSLGDIQITGISTPFQLSIHEATGHLLSNSIYSRSHISLHHLPKGYYLLGIKEEKGRWTYIPIIIQ